MACDPALGGDECVVYFIEDYEIKDTKYIFSNDTHSIGNDICIFMTKHTTEDLVIDAIGIGKGVADYCISAGKKVKEVISSAKAADEAHFTNLRSEMWALVAKKINERSVVYPADEKLRQQLCAVKYKTGSKKFELEPKAETKKALGSSPDRADAFVYGIWGMGQLEITIAQVNRGTEIAKGTNYNPLATEAHETRSVSVFN